MASSALSSNHRNGVIFCITSPFGLRFSFNLSRHLDGSLRIVKRHNPTKILPLRTTFPAGRRALSRGESRRYQLSISFLVLREARDLQHRPNLDGAHTRYWNSFFYAHPLVEMICLDYIVDALLFTRLR